VGDSVGREVRKFLGLGERKGEGKRGVTGSERKPDEKDHG